VQVGWEEGEKVSEFGKKGWIVLGQVLFDIIHPPRHFNVLTYLFNPWT